MAKSAPMSKTPPSLTAQSPLGGYEMITDGTSLIEVTGLSMVSVAPLAGSQAAFQTAMAKLFKTGKTGSPKPSATMALDRPDKPRCILMPSAQNQWFLCFDDDGTNPIDAAKALLGKGLSNQMAMTDQSDSWVILALSGLHSRQTLARICPIDCSASAMPIGTTARTSMEHLGAIITRRPDEGDHQPCFWLLSARSSATSFLHAITGSPPFRN
jgi:heterotetrameric sarcosine oxidase gamma subunit